MLTIKKIKRLKNEFEGEENSLSFKIYVAAKLAIIILGILACLMVTVFAGGRGGHNTTFDPALFPGATVSCLTASVAGKCTVAYNATCNGVADDSTPLKNWLAASLAANPARAVLYIPPGSKCHFASVNNFVMDTDIGGSGGFQYGDGIRNAVIWAYGAEADAFGVTGEAFGQNTLTTARFATVSAGSTTVILVNAGDASKFAVGNWVQLTGYQLQNGGNPPSFQFFEYRLITAIAGSTITFESPLVNSYKSTWPSYDQGGTSSVAITGAVDNGSGQCRVTVVSTAAFTTGDKRGSSQISGATGCNGNWTLTVVNATQIDLQGSTFGGTYTSGGVFGGVNLGGPATIYRTGPSWNTNIQIYGLALRPISEGFSSPGIGRNVAFYDNSWGQSIPTSSAAGPAPSLGKFISYYGSSIGTFSSTGGMEADKSIELLTITNSNGRLFFQSAGVTAIVSGFRGNVSGTPGNATFTNSVFPAVTSGSALTIGPNCYGHGDSLVLDSVNIASGGAVNCFMAKTSFSYSSGTFSISNVNVTTLNAFPFFVPGKKYFFGYAFGSTTCNAGVTFTVSDVTQDATDTHYVTDLVGALPAPTCDAGSGPQTYDRYVAYPAATITQRNSTGTNMTVFAPP